MRESAFRSVDCGERDRAAQNIRDGRADDLWNKDRNPRAAHTTAAVLRARIVGRAARILDARVRNDTGEQISALNTKNREPDGQQQPHHAHHHTTARNRRPLSGREVLRPQDAGSRT